MKSIIQNYQNINDSFFSKLDNYLCYNMYNKFSKYFHNDDILNHTYAISINNICMSIIINKNSIIVNFYCVYGNKLHGFLSVQFNYLNCCFNILHRDIDIYFLHHLKKIDDKLLLSRINTQKRKRWYKYL